MFEICGMCTDETKVMSGRDALKTASQKGYEKHTFFLSRRRNFELFFLGKGEGD